MLSALAVDYSIEIPTVDPAGPDAIGGPIPSHADAWEGYLTTSVANDIGSSKAADNISKVISGVPSYNWYHGCGPTAAGMVVGYWDNQGFSDLIPGNALSQTSAVDQAIASTEHYNDYSCPIDNRSTGILNDCSSLGGAHQNNCIADWMNTSWSSSSLYYGSSAMSQVDNAINDYCNSCGYSGFTAWNQTWSNSLWYYVVAEIDNNRPMVFLVDTSADGFTDHFVTVLGYDQATHRYACFNTWDHLLHWYDFEQISPGQSWGIYGVTFVLPPTPQPGDANGDGKVDGSDVTILANNWQFGVDGTEVATWGQGDFNGDGKVDGSDVTILANHWQHGVTSAAVSVPEPGIFVLLFCGWLPFLGSAVDIARVYRSNCVKKFVERGK